MHKRERGQTLIIALLVLGVLLILGAVYGGIISRTIRQTSQSKTRSGANDLAEAGIRYAHSELMFSDLGADWRGQTTPITDVTRDPDAYYLRPVARAGGVVLAFPGTNRLDQGGPDGLGPFFRVPFSNGRALVRVRYAPGDSSIFAGTGTVASVIPSGTGNLQNPGQTRNYLIIESVGRPGVVNVNDPTQGGTRGPVRVRNYADAPAFNTEYTRIRAFDEKELTGRKLIAFAQIGLIDNARFITNKFKVSRPAELGSPSEIGAQYNGLPVRPVQVIGKADAQVLNLGLGGPGAPSAGTYPAFGKVQVNTDLRIHGAILANLNRTLGDSFSVAGQISGADASSRLILRPSQWNLNNWVTNPPVSIANFNGLNSLSTNFSTQGGLVRDGLAQPDSQGFSRGVSAVTPPTILGTEETQGVSRYVRVTRDTGVVVTGTNSGAFGHGRGIYVDNNADFQVPSDEQGRQTAGGSVSQVQDWLNPFGDGTTFRSGWKGPFYVPVGAFVRLLNDGMLISRNSFPGQDANERTWKRPDGSDSGLTTIRYRFGNGTDGRVHVVNTLTPFAAPLNINSALPPAAFDLGPVFNGVVMFEGNVRVRGTIPTDVQLTLVSNRTIYIEGSILKGIVGNDVTSTSVPATAYGTRLSRPSRSALMLMAKDYVTLNPTMFFGPASDTNTQAQQGGQGSGGFNPVRLVSPDGSVSLQAELPLDQSTNPANPSTWLPLAAGYTAVNGVQLPIKLVLTHALEFTNPGPSNAFIELDINEGIAPNSKYQFLTRDSITNSAKVQWASTNGGGVVPPYGPIYGLGLENWQQSPKFESVGMPLLIPTQFAPNGAQLLTANGNEGNYSLLQTEPNRIDLRLTSFGGTQTGNYLMARAAIVPADVRIEASIYAEDGSFFVIPGDWFNPNPNDTRARWTAQIAEEQANGLNQAQAIALANESRLREFGSSIDMPFHGEPVDIKISIIGAVAENMPPPIAQQAEWLRKWGWIGVAQAANVDASNNQLNIPAAHYGFPFDPLSGQLVPNPQVVPNLTFEYDPALATGRVGGFSADPNPALAANPAVRYEFGTDGEARVLPPMPRLPVSPSLAYFGEIR